MALGNQLGELALFVGIGVIIVSVVATVLAQLQTTQTANSAAYNLTGDGLTAMGTFGDYFGLIVILGVLGLVLVLIYAFRSTGN